MSATEERDTLHKLSSERAFPDGPMVDRSQDPESVIIQYVAHAATCLETFDGVYAFNVTKALQIATELVEYAESLGANMRWELTL